MYAIVDIETTGGNAGTGYITEVAIILHDGHGVEGKYHTLVNPGIRIPPYISALTGITNDMVADAPVFEDVAQHIYNLLKDRIFVAHNVNFDYSFLKHHLASCGIVWNASKLCTVRLSRKILPGHQSYSLGSICRNVGIFIENRHRAMGDADATASLFAMLVRNDREGIISQMLKKGSRESYLPLHMPVQDVETLPHAAGVYYFHDSKQKIIYVGKAKDLKNRVVSHFSNNSVSRKKQELMRNVHRISFTVTGSEFTASILESLEIRRHWPAYNTSQKHIEFGFGIFMFEDQQGRKRLCIDRLRKTGRPLGRYGLLSDAHRALWKLVREHQLCAVCCFLQKEAECRPECKGVCRGGEDPVAYNSRVECALDSLREELPSFAIVEEGRASHERAWLLMEDGHFYGMGFLPVQQEIKNREELKSMITAYSGNEFVKYSMIHYARSHPQRMMLLQ